MNKIIPKAFSFALAAMIASFGSTAFAANADSMAGKVDTAGGNLNVRTAATQSSSIAASLKKGSYVTLLSKQGDWWKVEYAKGKYGFCHSDYIEIISDNTAAVKTQSTNLNVRSGASKSYPVIGSIGNGENIIILSSNGYWARVLYDGTKTGCVSADYLSANRKAISAISLDVPDMKQTDARWANVKIGSSGKTIGRIGCVTTGIAMMESFKTESTIYPDAMSKRLSYDGSGNVFWPSDYNVNYWSEDYLSVIYNILASGKPVLIGAKNAFGNQHWVVITGYNGSETLSPAGFLINDPGSSVNKNLGQFFSSYPYLYKFFNY